MARGLVNIMLAVAVEKRGQGSAKTCRRARAPAASTHTDLPLMDVHGVELLQRSRTNMHARERGTYRAAGHAIPVAPSWQRTTLARIMSHELPRRRRVRARVPSTVPVVGLCTPHDGVLEPITRDVALLMADVVVVVLTAMARAAVGAIGVPTDVLLREKRRIVRIRMMDGSAFAETRDESQRRGERFEMEDGTEECCNVGERIQLGSVLPPSTFNINHLGPATLCTRRPPATPRYRPQETHSTKKDREGWIRKGRPEQQEIHEPLRTARCPQCHEANNDPSTGSTTAGESSSPLTAAEPRRVAVKSRRQTWPKTTAHGHLAAHHDRPAHRTHPRLLPRQQVADWSCGSPPSVYDGGMDNDADGRVADGPRGRTTATQKTRSFTPRSFTRNSHPAAYHDHHGLLPCQQAADLIEQQ
ncbi:hypothetical protein BJ912DRAFT_1040979 [Pholiota molesta]|nr:hypothetical protein BJ912DRAFT_1040979 [Pholiota molesta]